MNVHATVPKENAVSDADITNVTPAFLTKTLQEAGYRIQEITFPNGVPQLRSATGGLAFDVQMGNAGQDGRYLDFTFLILLTIQGDMPQSIIDRWNNERRFSRLHRNQNLLLLDRDVSVAGGIAPRQLLAEIALWDRTVQDFVPWLRKAHDDAFAESAKTFAANADSKALKPEKTESTPANA